MLAADRMHASRISLEGEKETLQGNMLRTSAVVGG